MKIASSLAALRAEPRPVMLAAGFFDGVHRGHQAIVRAVVRAARRRGGRAWMLTFDRHPQAVLRPATAPPQLTPLPQKLSLLRALGADGCIVLPFTRALANRAPGDFAARLFAASPSLRRIVVGHSWTFGQGGRGTPAQLRRLAAARDIRVVVMPPVRRGHAPISSTRIRRAVAAGRFQDAAAMLGRPWSLAGTVGRGRGIGRSLGAPTANLDVRGLALPPNGVYLVLVRRGSRVVPGIANLGVRPTVSGPRARRTPLLELHLLGIRPRLYGQQLEVQVLRTLRRERRFSTLAALRTQIAQDVARAQAWFRRHAAVPRTARPARQPPPRRGAR